MKLTLSILIGLVIAVGLVWLAALGINYMTNGISPENTRIILVIILWSILGGGILALAIILGGAIGALIFYGIRKRKRKKLHHMNIF